MFPSLYNQQDAFRDMYPARVAEFTEEGRRANFRPSVRDSRKVALVVVDNQFDFVHPSGALSVPGSQADVARLIEYLYKNVEEVTSIYASLDTHREWQIFYNTWWVYQDNQAEHPAPFTIVSLNTRGEAADSNGRLVIPLIKPRWSLEYLAKLKLQAQKDLMLWPFHCMEGSMGHNLMPSLREAFSFHSAGRLTQVSFLTKGTSPFVEHYGIFAAEVPYPADPATGMNTAMLDAIAAHDLIYVAGEAKSHCVLETMRQLLTYFKAQPEVIRKIRFIIDCTSSVQHPMVDFESLAVAELTKMQTLGVELVMSTDPIS